MMTAILRDASGKMRHGILCDRTSSGSISYCISRNVYAFLADAGSLLSISVNLGIAHWSYIWVLR